MKQPIILQRTGNEWHGEYRGSAGFDGSPVSVDIKYQLNSTNDVERVRFSVCSFYGPSGYFVLKKEGSDMVLEEGNMTPEDFDKDIGMAVDDVLRQDVAGQIQSMVTDYLSQRHHTKLRQSMYDRAIKQVKLDAVSADLEGCIKTGAYVSQSA